MRIPLDYYRILGVTIQATDEQLNQAYHDRGVQLPRREYSEDAIAARRDLIEEAYQVLCDREARNRYNSQFLERTYQSRPLSTNDRYSLEEENSSEDNSIYNHTPWLDIAPENFVGALLILQELGEYELVIRIGIPELNNEVELLDSGDREETQASQRADIVLTVTLAYLELSREQWQQQEYQNAAVSGQIGLDLLTKECLFPSIRDEIQADLLKLRPYRILSLLSEYEENSPLRKQGIQLLQEMFQDRGGIDGKNDDGSGLDIDRFLRFLQQIRQKLTVKEQQQLFEAEAKRPSAVAAYLAVYTFLARGFAERIPGLILRAKETLATLNKRQDVYLEQAICALLLGQTEAASDALEKSKDREPLEFIRQHSQGAPDLLPGLCLYGEHWLQTEVLTQFRDLANRRESLQDYFADEGVQAYLEQLPLINKANEDLSAFTTAVNKGQQQPLHHLTDRSEPSLRQRRSGVYPTQQSSGATVTVERANTRAKQTATSKVDRTTPQLFNYSTVVDRHRTRQTSPSKTIDSTLSVASKIARKAMQRLLRSLPSDNRADRQSKLNKYWLLVPLAIAGMGTIGFLLVQNQLKQYPTPQIEAEQLNIQLDRPQIDLPTPAQKTVPTKQVLDREGGKQVLQAWLASKAQAFGPQHKVEQLKTILLPPLLEQWQKRALAAKAANAHMQYRHSIQIRSVQTSPEKPDLAFVEAQVREVARNYLAGKANQANSYDDTLMVRYQLVRQGDRWLIQDLKVIKGG